MDSRRKFIKAGLTGLAGVSLLPTVNAFASPNQIVSHDEKAQVKLRFALASDGHYGQPNTNSDKFFGDMVDWFTREHKENHLDFVIFNGDLVHDRPDLLPKVKKQYFDKLPVKSYAIPGNHDLADAALWKNVFGYEDKYVLEFGDIGFVLANTADTKGKYVCPDNAFIKNALEKFKSKKIVFVILHVPPHQWMPEEANIFINCPETIELLHAYPNVKATFHGHDHSLDGVRYTGKLPHFFDSHIGGNWGTDYKGYRIVSITHDNEIFTYQVNASLNPRLNSNMLK